MWNFQTLDWATRLQPHLYPIIVGGGETCKEVVQELEKKERTVLPEIKKAQAEVEVRIKAAETLALKGEPMPEENQEVIAKLMKLHDDLQSILTDFQVLIQILHSFFTNIAQVSPKSLSEYNEANNRGGCLPNILTGK